MTLVCNPVLETAEIRYSVQPGCGFLSEGYWRASLNPKTKKRSIHPGIDLNDVRGGDSDLGNRVRAIADGVVVTARDYDTWGGIVLIYHPALGVWSQSAHLQGIKVQPGQQVQMGDVIGHIGKAAWPWAHLHFEIRVSELPADFWPSARFPSKAAAEAYVREHYVDPEAWLEGHQALRTLDEVERARAERRHTAPATAPSRPSAARPANWYPVNDAATKQPISGRWVSVQRNKTTGELRVFEVPADKLRKEGLT